MIKPPEEVFRAMQGINIVLVLPYMDESRAWFKALPLEVQEEVCTWLRDRPVSQNNDLGLARFWMALQTVNVEVDKKLVLSNVVVDVACGMGSSSLEVHRILPAEGQNFRYNVLRNGIIKHPDCSPEEVMHAIGNYIHSISHQLNREYRRNNQS